MGFRQFGTVPDGWAEGVDLTILKMSRNECRWIEERLAA